MRKESIVTLSRRGPLALAIASAVLVAACVTGPSVAPRSSGAAPSASAPSPADRTDPVATAAPTPDPRLADLAENRVLGSVRIRLSRPVEVSGVVDAVCTYKQSRPLAVGYIETLGRVDVGSEALGAVIAVDPAAGGEPTLQLPREGAYRAGTRAWFGPQAGGRVSFEMGPPFSAGRVSFDELPTTADAEPVDLLPVTRDVYGSPLNDDPDGYRISGEIDWSCGAPRPPWQPGPPLPPVPPDDLQSGDLPPFGCELVTGAAGEGVRGAPICGFESEICSPGGGCTVGGDSCGTGWPAPLDYPRPVVVPAGGKLVLRGVDGWTMQVASAAAATVEEVEATVGNPDMLDLAVGRAVGADFQIRAPNLSGEWIVLIDVEARAVGEDGSTGTVKGRVLFQVDVVG